MIIDESRTGKDTLSQASDNSVLGKNTKNRSMSSSRDRQSSQYFRRLVWVATILGLGGRIAFVAFAKWHAIDWNDGATYHCAAQLMTHGYFFVREFTVINNNGASTFCFPTVQPTALHPPLFSLFLFIFDLLGFTGLGWQLIILQILGAAAIPLTALVGKKLFDWRVGVLAAFIAAAYPGMWLASGQIEAETLCQVLVLLTILFGYRLIQKPTYWRAIVVGIFGALAALTRSEQVLLLPFVGIGLIWHVKLSYIKAFKLMGIMAVTGLAIVSPWIIRNALVFKTPVFMSDDMGYTLAISYCNPTFYASPGSTFSIDSPSTEGSYYQCSYPQLKSGDESQQNNYEVSLAKKYVQTHLSRLPIVVLIREGRMWQFFDPIGEVRFDFDFEQWNYVGNIIKVICFYIMFPFTIIGALNLRKRRVLLLPLLAPIIVASIAVALFAYDPRFRVMSEASIVVLASAGMVQLVDRIRLK